MEVKDRLQMCKEQEEGEQSSLIIWETVEVIGTLRNKSKIEKRPFSHEHKERIVCFLPKVYKPANQNNI